MKTILTIILAFIVSVGMAQKKQHFGITYVKCHYYSEPDGESHTGDGKPLLDKHNNVTLSFNYKKLRNVKVGDTVIITYFRMPEKWDLDTDYKSESCSRCNSPWFEEYKAIVIKKY